MANPVDRLPEAGTQVLFDRLSVHPGGGALNQAVALARLGVRAALAAKVGRDMFGDFLLDTLKSEGVDIRLVVRAAGEPTCFTFAPIQSDGTRRYFSCLGTNASFRASEVKPPSAGCRLLSIGGVSVMPRLDGKPLAGILKAARKAGAMTTVDTAFNNMLKEWRPAIKPLLPHADYFFPSIEEARLITGEKRPEKAASRLRSWAGLNIGIKLGRQGAILLGHGGKGRPKTKREHVPSLLRVPAFRVPVRDASGAGDAFMAGFILGLLDGRPLRECLVRGCAVAAHCVQAVGCTDGLPDRRNLERFLRGGSE
jgi:sugar/nucleoside kinase (ribokinase family)